MHKFPRGAPMPPRIASAYMWSEELYFEHDINAQLPGGMHEPGACPIQNKLTDAVWQELNARWMKVFPTGQLELQKLWAVLMFLPALSNAFEQGAPGVEPVINDWNKTHGKPLQYLETLSVFADLLDPISDEVYASLIERLISNDLDSLAPLFSELYKAWESSNLEDCTRLLPRLHLAQDPVVRKAFFDERNSAWLPRILETLPNGKRTLIVVGAGHLCGPAGLVALLNREGHRLKLLA